MTTDGVVRVSSGELVAALCDRTYAVKLYPLSDRHGACLKAEFREVR